MPEFVFKAMNRLHRVLLKVTGGRVGHKVGQMPVVELTTIGRRSGEPRTVLLTAPEYSADRVVLVASKGGHDHDPAWYLNLQATPQVTITHRGEARTMVARTASDEERRALWPTIVSAYKGYEGYQRKTDRQIPVVIATPERS